MTRALSARTLRITTALLTVVIMITTLSLTTFALAEDPIRLPAGSFVRQAVVRNPNTSQYLNLRALPSVDAASMAQYRTGEPVEVWGSIGAWSLVRVLSDDRTGYMMTAYLSMMSVTPTPTPTYRETAYIATTNNGRLNLRETPAQASRSLGLYYPGTPVAVLQYINDVWAYVAVGGLTGDEPGALKGYMQRQYLTKADPSSSMQTYQTNAPSFIRSFHDWPLYAAPSDQAAISARYDAYQPLVVLGIAENWWHVYVPGFGVTPPMSGFIPADGTSLLAYRAAIVNVPGSTLNLRDNASYDSNVISQVTHGTLATVIDDSNPDWAYVFVGIAGHSTMYGYMQKSWLNYLRPSPNNQPVSTPKTVTLKANLSVPMRIHADRNADSVALYKSDGRPLVVLGTCREFTLVYDIQNGFTGFFESVWLI